MCRPVSRRMVRSDDNGAGGIGSAQRIARSMKPYEDMLGSGSVERFGTSIKGFEDRKEILNASAVLDSRDVDV